MPRLALAALFSSSCAAPLLAGVAAESSLALGSAAVQRRAGGCYAACGAGTTCNPRSGLCERMPCGGRCGAGRHCESTAAEDLCVPGAASDVLSTAPGSQTTIPVLPPPPPISSGPPQIVPAAEQYQPPRGR